MAINPPTFLFKNGVASPTPTPPISTFLQTHPGAYTTTRTHNEGNSLLFYERHMTRLSNSLQILLRTNPRLVFGPQFSGPVSNLWECVNWGGVLRGRVGPAIGKAVEVAREGRRDGEELAVSVLIGGSGEGVAGGGGEEGIERVLDVYVHVGMYMVPEFGVSGARLAVVCGRREVAQAKYSDWARIRKPLEALRPPSVTELLLSDKDGRILEGTITNFFVVCFKGIERYELCDSGNNKFMEKSSLVDSSLQSYELQTTPVNDGVLPGVIRQLVIEICLNMGIAVREVSPSWSERGSWEEAFITNSLRLVQHVESIQAPIVWTSLQSKSWEEVSWVEKQFKAGPGIITALIQKEIVRKAGLEGFSLALSNC